MDYAQRAMDQLLSLAPAQGAWIAALTPTQNITLAAATAVLLSTFYLVRQRAGGVRVIRRRRILAVVPPAPGFSSAAGQDRDQLPAQAKEPDIVISAAPAFPAGGFETLPLDATTKAGIGQLLRSLPGSCFTGAKAFQGGSSFILRLSPRIAKGIGAGSVAFMPGLRLGAGSSELTPLQASAPKMVALEMAVQGGKVFFGVWHVLAIMTAQKLLHDLGRRITRLEFGLRALKQWLENQLYGSIEGNYLHLRQIVDSLQGPFLSEKDTLVFSVQVEAAERELRQSSVQLKRQLEDVLGNIRAQQWNGVGLEENYQKAIDAVNGMERWSQALLLAIHVRAFGAGLRGALGLSQDHSAKIIASLLVELDDFARLQGQLIAAFGSKVRTLRGRFSFQSTDDDLQHKLKVRFAVAVQTTKAYYAELYDGLKRTDEALTVHINQQNRPLVLRVTVNDAGEIKSTEHLINVSRAAA